MRKTWRYTKKWNEIGNYLWKRIHENKNKNNDNDEPTLQGYLFHKIFLKIVDIFKKDGTR